MIPMTSLLEWLNYNERTHLSASLKLSIYQLNDELIPPSHRNEILSTIRKNGFLLAPSHEKAELQVILGVNSYNEHNFHQAKIDFQNALLCYSSDLHRLAITKWMLGTVLWKTDENLEAYHLWKDTIHIFDQLAANALKAYNVNIMNWYVDKLYWMRLAIVRTSEESLYSWLNHFKPTNLSLDIRKYTEKLIANINIGDIPLAYEIGRNLASLSTNRIDALETAEVWGIIGFATQHKRYTRQAIDFYKRGISAYPSWSHKQAVIRWMLGIALFDLPDEIHYAVKNWTDAIETFENLRIQAERKDDLNAKIWYETNIKVMKKALEELIRNLH
jgi:tetratricopeptide (TPR) repeat protein